MSNNNNNNTTQKNNINLKKDFTKPKQSLSNHLKNTNYWKVKDKDGKLISVPIDSLSNKHLCAALTTAIDNVSNLTKEKEALEYKLAKMNKHIENCTIGAMNMQETLKSREINFKYPLRDKLAKGILHTEVAEVFFEEEFAELKRNELIGKLNTNNDNIVQEKALPILEASETVVSSNTSNNHQD